VKVAEQLRQQIQGLHSTFDISSVQISKREQIPHGLLEDNDED
jgi:hypothetical protein